LAGISSAYYLRLEQGRVTRPSAQVVDALARALQLNVKATEHLHQLASVTAPASSTCVTRKLATCISTAAGSMCPIRVGSTG
jgi:transcriptional regulator with XRE-family HTH domain